METSIWIVVGAALITAVMTGVDALPLLLVKKLGKRMIGWSNAAAGLMLAASHSLISEGASIDVMLTLIGSLVGLGAIMVANRYLSDALNTRSLD